MKYYYEKPEKWSGAGETYICDHVLFNRCTLIKRGGKGIILIQERYNEKPRLDGGVPSIPGFPMIFVLMKIFRGFLTKMHQFPMKTASTQFSR